MSRWGRNEEAIEALRAANPVAATELRAAIGEAELDAAMGRAVALAESPSRPIPAGDRIAMEQGVTRRSRRSLFGRRRVLSVGLGVGCVVAIALALLLSGGWVDSVRDGAHPTYAEAAVEVAEANPRLLVTAPGWSIVHARGFEVDSGELIYKEQGYPTIGPGARVLELNWYPARLYRSSLHEHAVAGLGRRVTPVTSSLLGRRATSFHYPRQRPDFAMLLAPQGRVFVEIHGTLERGEYRTVLRSLLPVGVDAWLAAMPPEVVQPASRSQAIAQILAQLPVPPGFDPEALRSGTALTDRFMLGKAVAGAVACDWLGRWKSAIRSGDAATAEEAAEALGSARHWPVLVRMVREHGYDRNVLPPHGRGWPSQIVAVGREIAAGHLRRKPAAHTFYMHGEPVGFIVPAHAAPVTVLDCGDSWRGP